MCGWVIDLRSQVCLFLQEMRKGNMAGRRFADFAVGEGTKEPFSGKFNKKPSYL
jgi:hypothetical protein